MDHLTPNYILDDIVAKRIRKGLVYDPNEEAGNSTNTIKSFLATESKNFTLTDVNAMMVILQQRKSTLEAECTVAQNKLLWEFLSHMKMVKNEHKATLNQEIQIVDLDLKLVEKMIAEAPEQLVDSADGVNGSSSVLNSRKQRMHAFFDDFERAYFAVRTKANHLKLEMIKRRTEDVRKAGRLVAPKDLLSTPEEVQIVENYCNDGLKSFRSSLYKFSKYSSLRSLASMHYSSELTTSSTIVSTIVFDKDCEFFAIGGVTKRIKVYDYAAVLRDAVDMHYPVVEMVSSSKISCIAWNSYHKHTLASSEYEGAVNVWSAQTGQRISTFQEHEKRCWSVDFNEIDMMLFASGSDDGRVKLWSLNESRSLATIDVKANVCCVKFNPRSSCHLAFGSADHDVHYYDLRNPKKALSIFQGHKKAVSYVKFLNSTELISASTDSMLKLWNTTSSPYALRSFQGHINEKNFVGLATDGEYIACGSEDKAMYVYYKGLPRPMLSQRIDEHVYHAGGAGAGTTSLAADDRQDIDFVSAVCWKKNSNVLLAANSRGVIKIMELV